MLNKVSKTDLGLAYAGIGLRLALVLGLFCIIFVYGQYAYSGFEKIASEIRTERTDCQQLYVKYCDAKDATDTQRFSPSCARCRDVLSREDHNEIVVRWMNEHMMNLPIFGLCRLHASCFHAAADAISGLLTLWLIVKLAGVLLLLYWITNIGFLVLRQVVPMTQDYMKARFVKVEES